MGSCNNLGDERLESALTTAMPQTSSLAQDALTASIAAAAARALPAGMTERQYRDRLAELTNTMVGDIGERALEKILVNAGHELLMQSDKHVRLSARRLANDAVSVDKDGRMLVHDVKTTRNSKTRARTSAHGTQDLHKPRLSKTTDGARQLGDPYNLVRIEEAITFATEVKDGEGPQALVMRIDLRHMQYQMWEVDANGRIGNPVGPRESAATEIAEALREILREAGHSWP